jgi:hypothetical protein
MEIERAIHSPAAIDVRLDARAASFENPTGARGAGGTTRGGRKGAPSRRLASASGWCWPTWRGRGLCAICG